MTPQQLEKIIDRYIQGNTEYTKKMIDKMTKLDFLDFIVLLGGRYPTKYGYEFGKALFQMQKLLHKNW